MSNVHAETIVLDFGDDKPFITTKIEHKCGFKIWSRPDGTNLADGLFKMHDQEGFPLMMSLMVCKEKGLIPCIKQFRIDAMMAGWSEDKIERTIKEAQADSQ